MSATSRIIADVEKHVMRENEFSSVTGPGGGMKRLAADEPTTRLTDLPEDVIRLIVALFFGKRRRRRDEWINLRGYRSVVSLALTCRALGRMCALDLKPVCHLVMCGDWDWKPEDDNEKEWCERVGLFSCCECDRELRYCAAHTRRCADCRVPYCDRHADTEFKYCAECMDGWCADDCAWQNFTLAKDAQRGWLICDRCYRALGGEGVTTSSADEL
jgi:hypothetical protein